MYINFSIFENEENNAISKRLQKIEGQKSTWSQQQKNNALKGKEKRVAL
jgi:hypothetical protein